MVQIMFFSQIFIILFVCINLYLRNVQVDAHKSSVFNDLVFDNECIKKYIPYSTRGFEGIFNTDSKNNYIKCFMKHMTSNNMSNKKLNEGYIYVIYNQNITEVI